MSNWNEGVLDRSNTKMFTRNILRNVYIWMTVALGITAVVAYGLAQNTDFVVSMYKSGLIYGIWIAQFILAVAVGGFVMKMNPVVAMITFVVYAVLMGISLSGIFLVYSLGSIYQAFFSTTALFAGMSLYGYFTKRDLTSWGTFLGMAVFGILIAVVINLFLQASVLSYIISFVTVIVFTGLTAYDTQRIKQMSESYGDQLNEADYLRLSISGALSLYINFINIFVSLLRLFGTSRD